MERDEGFRPVSDGSLDIGRIEVQIGRARDVTKHRDSPDQPRRVRGGNEVERGHDDLVAGSTARGQQCEMERGRAARRCNSVRNVADRGELLLELSDARSRTPPAGADRGFGGRDEFVVDRDVG